LTTATRSPQPPAITEPWRTPVVELPVSDHQRTVAYHSDPVGKAYGFVIKYLGLCIASGILSTGLVLYLRADAVIWLILMGMLTFAGWCAVGWTENLFSPEGIDRLRIRTGAQVQMTYVDAEREVEIERLNIAAERDANRRLSAQIEQLYLEIDALRRDNLHAPQHERNRLRNYAPQPDALAHADPGPDAPPPIVIVGEPPSRDAMVLAVQRWVIAAYSNTWISADGRVVKGDMPWSTRGTLVGVDKDRARDWIQHAGRKQAAWLLRYDAARRGWYVNLDAYPTAGAMLAALDSTIPSRRDG
jgi:hypothetical protein